MALGGWRMVAQEISVFIPVGMHANALPMEVQGIWRHALEERHKITVNNKMCQFFCFTEKRTSALE
jgi:hypothetical protein